jgi:SAM-dependent methyltransferase
MTVKEHYDNHLGNFYSWYVGEFSKNKEAFKFFCINNNIKPNSSKQAIDLGAGNGIQTVALAELGFHVTSIDFNQQLVDELTLNAKNLPVTIIKDDFRNLKQYKSIEPELIVCCGDTLTHLDSKEEIVNLLSDSFEILASGGKLILSFRDYSFELQDTQRFIPVCSDVQRVFTCFLEYFDDKVRVTDLLYEREEGRWMQKVSSYFKIRLTEQWVVDCLKNSGFTNTLNMQENRIIHIIAQK